MVNPRTHQAARESVRLGVNQPLLDECARLEAELNKLTAFVGDLFEVESNDCDGGHWHSEAIYLGPGDSIYRGGPKP